MENQFKKLLQIGIIVEDIEASVNNYETNYGLGPWRYNRLSSASMPQLHIDGKPGDLEIYPDHVEKHHEGNIGGLPFRTE